MIETVDRKSLAVKSQKMHNCAQTNLAQLAGRCAAEEITQDYYLGMLRRQAILTLDLKTIFEKSPADNLTTTPLIICRCLTDDFLHVFFLTQSNNETENIVRINAEAYAESFKSLDGITKSNHQHFGGKYDLYTSGADLKKVKEIFASKPENKRYFADITKLEFKKFMTNAALAEGIKDFELSKISFRALYLWKEFSKFMHYSNVTFNYEMSKSNREIFLLEIEETLLYCYNTIKWSFHFFEKRDGFTFDDMGLDDRYKIEKQK